MVDLLPSAGSTSLARRVVSDLLVQMGREELIDDATLVVSELVANGVMHARTPMRLSVEPAGDGIRIGVSDSSPVQPHRAPPQPASTSGRGLHLVERLAGSWGTAPLAGGGKTVWAQLDRVAAVEAQDSVEDLLELWAEATLSVPGPGPHAVEVAVVVDVALMVASRGHTEDLLRDLQLVLLGDSVPGADTHTSQQIIWLARRLVAATDDFAGPREQMLADTVLAQLAGLDRVTLHLLLSRHDGGAARRWLEAVDEAASLAGTGVLLTGPFPPELTAFRHAYIEAILAELHIQLEPA